MKYTPIRLVLVMLEALVALGAIVGGVSLVRGIITFPLTWLQETPFSDYTIPGLMLAIVVGGSAFLAAATVFIQRLWAAFVSLMAGLLMAGYEVVHIALIDHLAWLYALYFVLDVVIFGLAADLWMAEYRRHLFPSSRDRPC